MVQPIKDFIAGREALRDAAASGELRYCELTSVRELGQVATALAHELDAALARRGRLLLILWDADEAPPAGAAAEPADGALVVHTEGRWFQLPSGERVDCRRRHTLCRILVRLARGRLHAPRRPLTTRELLDAGWPDESIQPEAALGRLRVAINTLRGLGLRDHLFSHGGGYLLDPSVTVRLEARAPGPLEI